MTGRVGPWAGRIAIRLLTGLSTLTVVAVGVFLALHLLKGGFANLYLGPTATPESIAALNRQYGFDAPVLVQLWRWVRSMAQGDFGISLVSGESVSSLLADRLPVTAELAVYASVLAIVIGFPVGVLVGTVGRRRRSATGLRAASALSVSLPDFVVGAVIVYTLSRVAPSLLSIGSHTSLVSDTAGNLRQFFFPALTLALFPAAILVRTLRDSVQSTLAEPYVRAALIRGESRRQIIRRHVLRNSSLPALTVSTVNFGYLFGGAVIVENIFGLPGMGQELVNAINQRDYAVVQVGVLVGAAAFISINILSDWMYTLVDPRLRLQGAR